jgi:hypothetical protein
VVPELVGSARTPYAIIGAGYAALALAMFLGAASRERELREALERGGWAGVPSGWLLVMTAGAGALALATLVVILIQP